MLVPFRSGKMADIREFNEYGKTLVQFLGMRTSPLAEKMLVNEDDIPEGAYRPRRDDGIHYAQCQAFALSRRDKRMVAMLKEDNWCPAPITAFGLDERLERPDMVPGKAFGYYRFEPGRYIGILTAPLETAPFVPDLVLMYPTTNQLRSLLSTFSPEEGEQIESHFFAPSCTYAVVNPMIDGKYWIVLPDPGETARAVADDGEMMISIPQAKMEGMMMRIQEAQARAGTFRMDARLMQHDFAQPPHYIRAFEMWGMEHDTPGRFKM